MTAALTRLALLTEDECHACLCKVLLLRHAWTRRHPWAPFFTLGKAAYLDLGAAYAPAASNELLRRHFHPLLERVRAAMATHLDQPVTLVRTQAALPGFHIYEPHPVFALPVARIHRDLQHLQAFPGPWRRPPQVITFTLPVGTPRGSGITFMAEDGNAFCPYHDGELVIHDGQPPHQAVLACDGASERVTLQGHGIRRGRRWLLYW